MRTKNSGSVYREGERWVARLPNALGRAMVGSYDTEDDAAAALAVRLEDLATRGPVLEEWGDHWLLKRRQNEDLVSGHQDLVTWRRLVTGTDLGALGMLEVEPLDVRRWLASLRRQDGSKYVSTSLGCYLSIVTKVFDAACDEGVVSYNPCAEVRTKSGKGKKPGRGKLKLTATQIDAVITTAREVLRPDEATAIAVLAVTGMRIAELRHLTWAEIDLAAGEIRLVRSKSAAGERLVLLLPPAVEALREWRGDEQRVGLVFPKLRGGGKRSRGWHCGMPKVRKATGIRKLTPGCLRGSVGSILLSGGWVDRGWVARPLRMEEVQTWLGHETPSVTAKHYAKMSDEALRRTVVLPVTCQAPSEAPGIAMVSGAREKQIHFRRTEWTQ
ncbi:MAG: tyrosine-type recombinase/integrase [Deltaproteobacteria bacterium]|nr:tyrosine-type recombinase/integrase [Deltaproteobacteria bacterium]